MPKYRIEYAKVGQARFLSHLELIRVFQRAFRRARLPQTFTQGFNPHQKLSFGPPLGVGVAGEREYLDLELEAEIELRQTCARIAAQFPGGLRLRQLVLLEPNSPGLGKLIDTSWYRLEVTGAEAAEVLVGMPQAISVCDETAAWSYTRPRDGKRFDLRQGIIALRAGGDTAAELLLKLGAGEVPLRGVEEQLLLHAGLPDAPHLVTRRGLYRRLGERLVTPLGEVEDVWTDGNGIC